MTTTRGPAILASAVRSAGCSAYLGRSSSIAGLERFKFSLNFQATTSVPPSNLSRRSGTFVSSNPASTMATSSENKKFKLQVFGGTSEITGLYLHTAVDTNSEPVRSELVITKIHGPRGTTKIGTTVKNPPKPKDEFIVGYFSDSNGGVLSSYPEGIACALEGASGRGLWTLYGDPEPDQPAGMLGWDKKRDRFVVEQVSERDFFLGVNVNTFPGSGIFVASRDPKEAVGIDRWIISWLEPGTASMELLENPIPIRIALVPVDS